MSGQNFSLISEFMTSMGRIKHSSETGLRPVNQRKMAKAIRRAVGMGLHPSVHKHPEILRLSRHSLPTSAIPTPAEALQNRL
jgi:small subunit ribosomal protein S18